MKAKPYVRVEGGEVIGYTIYCPGCKTHHGIPISGSVIWSFNGNPELPTFSPSLLVRSGHYMPNWQSVTPEGTPKQCWCDWNKKHPEEEDPFTCGVCHSFITDGKIQFLGDCTHELANQTVELPDL